VFKEAPLLSPITHKDMGVGEACCDGNGRAWGVPRGGVGVVDIA